MKADRRRPDTELVQQIEGELRPLKADVALATPAAIIESLNRLRSVSPQFFSRQAVKDTRKDARQITGTTQKLNRLLDQASPELRLRLKLEPIPGYVPPLTAALDAALDECAAAVASKASHENEVMKWCALEAWRLIVTFSDRRPSSGSATSPLRVIASLVYEAVTGIRDKDLRRTCDVVHQERLHLLRKKKSTNCE
jgi:hypothetical protein